MIEDDKPSIDRQESEISSTICTTRFLFCHFIILKLGITEPIKLPFTYIKSNHIDHLGRFRSRYSL